ncbi:hypothetical protein B0H11DRAFT_2209854 [Mycena galericulata]|nr:hypothetical protein B0H11DRAFT_2209854 [Mycena galericulata]
MAFPLRFSFIMTGLITLGASMYNMYQSFGPVMADGVVFNRVENSLQGTNVTRRDKQHDGQLEPDRTRTRHQLQWIGEVVADFEKFDLQMKVALLNNPTGDLQDHRHTKSAYIIQHKS